MTSLPITTHGYGDVIATRIAKPPDLYALIRNLEPETFVRLVSVGATLKDGRYLHWDDIRRREPPEGLTVEQWWAGMRLARNQSSRPTGLVDVHGIPFSYSLVDPILKSLHHLELRATGRSAAPAAVLDRTTRDRYKVRGLIEEALSSSQLEGASTTRVVAKQMLRSGRGPRDKSERMIFNNYRAISHIKEAAPEDLTPELLLRMHAILTEDTLEHRRDCGRFQQPDETRVSVVAWHSDEVVFAPPPAEQIPERIERMCDFANDGEKSFTHPLVKAILLHFWLAYIHPFVDGNGRAARALFYWSALRAGYWLTEYVSISEIVLKAPAKYSHAFLHTETDGNDLTYFLIHQLEVLRRAFEELAIYVDETLERMQAAARLAGDLPGLNHRQRALLGHALRHRGYRYTYRSHANSHDVVLQTARTDLLDLTSHGLLDAGVEGRRRVFISPDDLGARLRASNKDRAF